MSHFKPYPRYKGSGIDHVGQIPFEWRVTRLDHVTETHRENISPDQMLGTQVMHYSIPAVQEHGTGLIEQGESIDSSKLVVRGPQVLVSKLNPRKGTVVIANKDPLRLTVASTEFVPLIPRGEKMHLRFLAYLVVSSPMRQLWESRVESVTKSHQRVLSEEISKAWLGAPPFSEQMQIANYLDKETVHIDALITKKTRFLELLNEKRQALIRRAVTKGLDRRVRTKDSKIDWIGHVPEHWAVSRLGHFATIENGTTPSRANQTYWTDGSVAWLGSGEVNQVVVTEATEYITKLALNECSLRLLPRGTVIIGMIGQGKTRGLAAILEIEATINQNLAAVCVGPRLLANFLLHTFTASYEWLREAGRGSNQAALNCELLGAFRVPVPPIAEQQEILAHIAERSDRINSIVSKTQRSIALLKERRSVLITAAVTGRIDLRDAA